MEVFGITGMSMGIIGLVFGIIAMSKVDKLEKHLKQKGILDKDFDSNKT